MSNSDIIKSCIEREQSIFDRKKFLIENGKFDSKNCKLITRLIGLELSIFHKHYRLEKSEIRKSRKVRNDIRNAMRVESELKGSSRVQKAEQVDKKRLSEEEILQRHEHICRDGLREIYYNLKRQEHEISLISRNPSDITKRKERLGRYLDRQLELQKILDHHEDIAKRIRQSEEDLNALEKKIAPKISERLKQDRKSHNRKIMVMVVCGVVAMFIFSSCASFGSKGRSYVDDSSILRVPESSDQSVNAIMKRIGKLIGGGPLGVAKVYKTSVDGIDFVVQLNEVDNPRIFVHQALGGNENLNLVGGEKFLMEGPPHLLSVEWIKGENSGRFYDLHVDGDLDGVVASFPVRTFSYSESVKRNGVEELVSKRISAGGDFQLRPLSDYERSKIEGYAKSLDMSSEELISTYINEAENLYPQLVAHLREVDQN